MTSPAPAQRAALEALLASIFLTAELRRWLRHAEDYVHLVADLDEQRSLSSYAEQVCDALIRHGLVRPLLFDRLRDYVPNRAGSIDRVESLWFGEQPPRLEESIVLRASQRAPALAEADLSAFAAGAAEQLRRASADSGVELQLRMVIRTRRG